MSYSLKKVTLFSLTMLVFVTLGETCFILPTFQLQRAAPWCQMRFIFLSCVFLSALWFGRPCLTTTITNISPSTHHRAGKSSVYFSWAFWTLAVWLTNLSPSLQCPISQLNDKVQSVFSCQFLCPQLCFIRSSNPPPAVLTMCLDKVLKAFNGFQYHTYFTLSD